MDIPHLGRRIGESLAAGGITMVVVFVVGFVASRTAFLFRNVDRRFVLRAYHWSIGGVALLAFVANLAFGEPANGFLRDATFWSLVVTIPVGVVTLFVWTVRRLSGIVRS